MGQLSNSGNFVQLQYLWIVVIPTHVLGGLHVLRCIVAAIVEINTRKPVKTMEKPGIIRPGGGRHEKPWNFSGDTTWPQEPAISPGDLEDPKELLNIWVVDSVGQTRIDRCAIPTWTGTIRHGFSLVLGGKLCWQLPIYQPIGFGQNLNCQFQIFLCKIRFNL